MCYLQSKNCCVFGRIGTGTAREGPVLDLSSLGVEMACSDTIGPHWAPHVGHGNALAWSTHSAWEGPVLDLSSLGVEMACSDTVAPLLRGRPGLDGAYLRLVYLFGDVL